MADYLVRAAALAGYNHLVEELHGDPIAMREAAGIAATTLPNDSWISYSAFLQLLELSAKTLNCPHFGLQLSRYQDVGMLGAVGFIMCEAADVGTALTELSKYFSLYNQGADIGLVVQADSARLSFGNRMAEHLSTWQQTDLALGVGLNIIRLLLGPDWHPNATYFDHAEPADRRPYRALTKSPLHFNCEAAMLVFDATDLSTPISNANEQLHQILQTHLALLRQNFVSDYPEKIRHLIRQALLTGDCSVERVAAYLSITKRTLQRKLSATDTSYQNLLDEVRLSMATRYLTDSNSSLSQLTEMLGYSELSAFSNAFKHWTGLSPNQWKARYAR